jgi:hypothetical protein
MSLNGCGEHHRRQRGCARLLRRDPRIVRSAATTGRRRALRHPGRGRAPTGNIMHARPPEIDRKAPPARSESARDELRPERLAESVRPVGIDMEHDGSLPVFWPIGDARSSGHAVLRDLVERCIIAGWAQRDAPAYPGQPARSVRERARSALIGSPRAARKAAPSRIGVTPQSSLSRLKSKVTSVSYRPIARSKISGWRSAWTAS